MGKRRKYKKAHRAPAPSSSRRDKSRQKAERKAERNAARKAMRAIESEDFPQDGPKKAHLFTTIEQWVTDDTNKDKESARGLWI